MVGTMIEIPRAALTGGHASRRKREFFSFGTNDLTQTTMGLSRDDYTKFQKTTKTHKIFKADPFAVLDQEGVGKLVEMAVKTGPQGAAGSRSRDLRRARRRAEFGRSSATGSAWTMFPARPIVCRSHVWPPRRPRSRAIKRKHRAPPKLVMG